jgi:hypothetical protein
MTSPPQLQRVGKRAVRLAAFSDSKFVTRETAWDAHSNLKVKNTAVKMK